MSLEVTERYNVSSLLDENLEAGRGEKIAVRSETEELTYAGLHDRVCRAGRALQELGVQGEQRVLMAMDDTPSWPAVFLGAIRIGAVPVPVSYLDTPANFQHFVRDSEARVILLEAAALGTMQEAVAGLDHPPPLVVVNGSADRLESLEALLEAHAGELPPADTHRDDFAFWLFSGGSTGQPKGAVHLQHDIPYTIATFGRQILRISEDDVCFSTTKLYHAYGMGNGMSFPFAVGATAVLMAGKPDPAKIFAHIEKYRPTLFFSVPTLYGRLSGAPEAATTDFSSIRMCCSAAEPLAPEVLRRWQDVTGLEICDGIGSTEMLHIYCSNRPGDVHPGTSGRPVPGYELKLLDHDEQPVAQGEVGNLFVKGDSALAFYWHQHEKSKGSVRGDWYFTGDRYRQTEDGVFVYEGRADDMIKIGGLWASPIAIENAIMEHPDVLEVAAIGIEADFTTRVKAFVVPRGGEGSAELAGELKTWCKQRLRRYEYPEFIEFLDELPKTPTGKIQRYKLRSLESGVTQRFA